MKILGIGVDIVENKRLKKSIKNKLENIYNKDLEKECLPQVEDIVNTARHLATY